MVLCHFCDIFGVFCVIFGVFCVIFVLFSFTFFHFPPLFLLFPYFFLLGHRFNSPIVLPETFDPFNASTSSTDPSSTSSKKDDTPSESSRVVWIRGLPWQTSGDDVKAFFNGLDVDQIQFNVNPNGRMNGEAYVIFTTKEQAAAAMTRYNRKV